MYQSPSAFVFMEASSYRDVLWQRESFEAFVIVNDSAGRGIAKNTSSIGR
jgi:hypothetical protein